MNKRQKAVVAEFDAKLQKVGLPTYTELSIAPRLLTWAKWALDRIKEDVKPSFQYEKALTIVEAATKTLRKPK